MTLEAARGGTQPPVPEIFDRYMNEEASKFISKYRPPSLGGAEFRASVLVFGIDNYAELMEGRRPTDMMDLLNRLHRVTNPAVLRNHGRIDKYLEGGGIFATFGAPIPLPHAELSAVQAARSIRKAVSRFTRNPENPPFEYRIGVATGEVAFGNIGSQQRLEYATVGEPVTLAHKMAGLAKYFATDILVDENTYNAVGNMVEVGEQHIVTPLGMTKAIACYPLI